MDKKIRLYVKVLICYVLSTFLVTVLRTSVVNFYYEDHVCGSNTAQNGASLFEKILKSSKCCLSFYSYPSFSYLLNDILTVDIVNWKHFFISFIAFIYIVSFN